LILRIYEAHISDARAAVLRVFDRRRTGQRRLERLLIGRRAWAVGRPARARAEAADGGKVGTELNVGSYRHAAVSIGRKIVGEWFAAGYQKDINEEEAAEAEMDESLVELQNRRMTAIGALDYGVSIKIIGNLNERSVERFREVSRQWHGMLGFSEAAQAAEEEAEAKKRRLGRGRQSFARAGSEDRRAGGSERPGGTKLYAGRRRQRAGKEARGRYSDEDVTVGRRLGKG
jgi:phage FluMu protein gp41